MSTAHTFASKLKSLGLVIPENTTGINISCNCSDDKVVIVFKMMDLNSRAERKEKHICKDASGNYLTVREFYEQIKYFAQLPEETIKFEITAEINEVVKITIESALPEDAFENIKSL